MMRTATLIALVALTAQSRALSLSPTHASRRLRRASEAAAMATTKAPTVTDKEQDEDHVIVKKIAIPIPVPVGVGVAVPEPIAIPVPVPQLVGASEQEAPWRGQDQEAPRVLPAAQALEGLRVVSVHH
ncbi:hypothetical protein P43SY_009022 [Pythium insidiosum]|uniref:Uncharacterized protein n=1 Tax=Pythium insidiosum TaxID=114742 RepID=A0AAD5QBZ9_PYTIN|nr:hypothetical protein P43SY_009022 [Pythium insidiosum]